MVKVREFVGITGSEFPEDRLTYQKGLPTFHPQSAAEAARLFKLANKHNQRIYITGFGNNIDPQGEPFADLMVVRTDRLNQIIDVVPDDYYVITGAGYPLREIKHRLKRLDLYLPHAALPYVGSVGGAVAVGLSGELHGQPVPIKKHLIKAEIVTPEGDIISPGSICFKSVSGYDIVKLFAGSWGLLGLIVTATFRVMPLAGAEDFAAMTQKKVDRANFLAGLEKSSNAADVVYSRKIKNKFDPKQILPKIV